MKIYKKQETKNVVYFIKKENGLVKIGTTQHFEKRKKALESQNGEKFKKFFMVEGSYSLESYFHRKYIKKNKMGEWFDLDFNELYKEIQSETVQIATKEFKPYNLVIDFTIEYTFADIMNNYLRSFEYILNNEKYLKDNFTGSIDNFISEFKKANCDVLSDEEIEESIEEFEEYDSLYDYIELYLLPEKVDYVTNILFKKFLYKEIELECFCNCVLNHIKEICNDFNDNTKGKNIVHIDFSKMFQAIESKIAIYIETLKDMELTDKETYDKVKKMLDKQ